MSEHTYVDTPEALQAACAELASATVLCVDTEFHREKTYYAQFALLQIASRNACYVIDPTALKDLTPVWELMHNDKILKVFHAARQDVEIILFESGKLPLPLFDTQVAAALLGYGQQVGFGNLVQRLLKKALPKQESFSDWLARPLTSKQLAYAADDVIFLFPLYQQLQDELVAKGRRKWLDEEQEVLTQESTYRIDKREVFWRVKGSNRLKPKQLAVLRELADWRETEAQRKDIPRRRIFSDDSMVDIAKREKLTSETFQRMRGVTDGMVRRFGDAIIAAWQKGMDCPEAEWPKLHPRHHHAQGTELRQEMLDTLLRLRAEDESIAANILASQSELGDLASWGRKCSGEPPKLALLHGWRRELVGDDMLRLLAGEIALKIDPARGVPVIERR